MLWIQKNDATRAPRVTGRTWWRLVDGIEHEMTGRQLHRVHAVGVLDHQLAAVVLVRVR